MFFPSVYPRPQVLETVEKQAPGHFAPRLAIPVGHFIDRSMRTALDALTSQLDQHEQDFVAKIREFGWFGTNVFEDAEGPGFSYTTGFWVSLGVPEVIVFSLN